MLFVLCPFDCLMETASTNASRLHLCSNNQNVLRDVGLDCVSDFLPPRLQAQERILKPRKAFANFSRYLEPHHIQDSFKKNNS